MLEVVLANTQAILFIIKLVFGGFAAFFAIILWSKTRDAAWMAIVAGAITSYAGIVYEMMKLLGIVVLEGVMILDIPLATLLFTTIPYVFFITGFLIMIFRNRY